VVRGGAREFSPVMQRVLERLAPKLAAHHDAPELPNTCLINCYGREMSRLPNGREKPALFEFVDGAKPDEPELLLWLDAAPGERVVSLRAGDAHQGPARVQRGRAGAESWRRGAVGAAIAALPRAARPSRSLSALRSL